MITYFDTSSLIKLVVDETGSDRASAIWETADNVAAVRLVIVEGRAALAAASRAGRLTSEQYDEARQEFSRFADGLAIVEVTETLVAAAADLAEEEGLRGYDAVHLAGALALNADVMCSADDDLCAAAERRGLHIANPNVPVDEPEHADEPDDS